MLLRCGGVTINVRRYSLKIWAFCSMLFFIFSAIHFLSYHGNQSSNQATHGDHRENGIKQIKGQNLNTDFNLKPVENKSAKNRFDEKEIVQMAMDSNLWLHEEVMTKQRQILQRQKRPPDNQYNINVTLSDTISMDRKITDTRPPVCRTLNYNRSVLGKAAVIIPFYNEALSMLIRTVHSVLNNSPEDLLHEVILVDDYSTHDYLKESFHEYIELLPKTRIIRNRAREGLIKSRLMGSRSTDAPVVIFLDAHTEANVGWLEPLLEYLHQHPNSVVQPYMDRIDARTIEYSSPPGVHKGTFSWDLGYRWQKITSHESSHTLETGYPFFSPTLVGCAIAVNQEYFRHIGEFDEGLKVWGGENIELGFRTWQCGGRVVTVTCSRVGHVYKNFSYKFDGNREQIVTKNLMRVAETWMDGYRKFYYASSRTFNFKRAEFNEEELTSLAERIELRKRLKCENFEWYMYNIAPDVDIPPIDAVYYGEITNTMTNACWEPTVDYYIGMNYVCYTHKIIPRNYFHISDHGQLKYNDKCVRLEPPKASLRLGECPTINNPADQIKYGIWSMGNLGPTWGTIQVKIKNKDGSIETFCVVQVTNVYLKHHYKAQMVEISQCDNEKKLQIWSWTYRFSWDQVPERLLTNNGIGKYDHFISNSYS